MRRQGQAVVTDLFIAVLIFTITVALLITAYNSYYRRLASESSYNDMILSAFYFSEAAIDSIGYPTSWNASNVSVIGLADEHKTISTEKMQQFVNLSYNRTKQLLGLGGKEFFFQVRGPTGLVLAEHGVSPLEDRNCSTYQSVSAERLAYWQGQKVVVQAMVWDDICEREGGAGSIIAGGAAQYRGVPEEAFEEDGSPVWAAQVQTEGDFVYATASDEGLIMPDYVQFNFPDLGIPPSKVITNASVGIRHRDELTGGTFPSGENSRRMLQCWNGVWNDIATYSISPSNTTWADAQADISNCITTVNLANNINVRMTFDPAFDSGGKQDIDYAEVVVSAI